MTQASSSYARIEGDKYFTPAWVTEALLSAEAFHGAIYDPAAGAGHIINAVIAAGGSAFGSDIAPDAGSVTEADFFNVAYDVSAIVTNPPYGVGSRLAVRFTEHALDRTKSMGGKVAMLLKVGFDSAKGRRHLFDEHPAFAVEYRLTDRIRWANLEQSAAGPTENHSWFVWSWAKDPLAYPIKRYLP